MDGTAGAHHRVLRRSRAFARAPGGAEGSRASGGVARGEHVIDDACESVHAIIRRRGANARHRATAVARVGARTRALDVRLGVSSTAVHCHFA